MFIFSSEIIYAEQACGVCLCAPGAHAGTRFICGGGMRRECIKVLGALRVRDKQVIGVFY